MGSEGRKIKLYEMTQAQDMILYMLRFSLHKQVIQIPSSITLDKPIDFNIMKKAVSIEIARNDCMRLCFVIKKGKWMQYFNENYIPVEIPVLTFTTAQEQEQFLCADAQRPLTHLNGKIYKIFLFNSYDGRQGIYMNVSHLCMDLAAVLIFYNDLMAVYSSLANGEPLPKPLGSFELAVQNELKIKTDKEAHQAHEAAFTEHFLKFRMPHYLDAHGTERLQKLKKSRRDNNLTSAPCYNPVFDKAQAVTYEASQKDSDIIFKFCRDYGVSPEVLIETAMHIHLSSINNNNPDHCFFTLCTRRNNRNAKRCGGTMTSALTWRLSLPVSLSFAEALGDMTELQGWIFRHMDYPFISCRRLLQKLYPYSLITHPASTMFSWIGLDQNSINGWSYDFRTYNFGRYVMPLYTIAMRNPKTGCLKMSFVYRPHYITGDDISSLFEHTVKALLEGANNPELTLKQIIDKL